MVCTLAWIASRDNDLTVVEKGDHTPHGGRHHLRGQELIAHHAHFQEVISHVDVVENGLQSCLRRIGLFERDQEDVDLAVLHQIEEDSVLDVINTREDRVEFLAHETEIVPRVRHLS